MTGPDKAEYIRDPAEIYRASFATIEAEADLARYSPGERTIAIRMIHACGMTDLADDLVFSPGAVSAGVAALAGGAAVICDVEKVRRGGIAARPPSGKPPLCAIAEPAAREHAARMANTVSAGAIEALRDRIDGAVVAIGNAPTALFRLLELVAEGAVFPALVIGCPVGFVGATESKLALEESGVPFITVRGRRGGSAMAAAAVNALCGLAGEEGALPSPPSSRGLSPGSKSDVSGPDLGPGDKPRDDGLAGNRFRSTPTPDPSPQGGGESQAFRQSTSTGGLPLDSGGMLRHSPSPSPLRGGVRGGGESSPREHGSVAGIGVPVSSPSSRGLSPGSKSDVSGPDLDPGDKPRDDGGGGLAGDKPRDDDLNGGLRPWLTILGIGDDGVQSLTPAALALLTSAKRVIAPERVLASLTLPGHVALEPWTGRIHETIDALLSRRGEPVTILATGDPMHFGIGATMAKRLAKGEMRVIPSPSAFSLAAARLGWALQDVECLSLHGRAVAALGAHLQPGRRVLALTSHGGTVREAAALATEAGFGASRLTVLEHMGGRDERMVETSAVAAQTGEFADFNTLALELLHDGSTPWRPRVPGLPDDAFEHDGQLTKREVRAATLAALAPFDGGLLWDIGAGCGSIAIEWMRSARGARAIAIEPSASRRAMIAANALALGVPGLAVIDGEAPAALAGLAAPDAVFIGGGLNDDGVFETAFAALKPGGRLVANVVTLEGEARLAALHGAHGGALCRIAVSRASPVGPFRGFKPLMTVTQWEITKGRGQ